MSMDVIFLIVIFCHAVKIITKELRKLRTFNGCRIQIIIALDGALSPRLQIRKLRFKINTLKCFRFLDDESSPTARV